MALVTLRGYVDHIIYSNPDNGYTVLELVCNGEVLTLTGSMGGISEGESISAEGEFVTHPSYGEQFAVSRFEITEPEDLDSIERYLSFGGIKGIGRAMAARIVKHFKYDTLRVLDEEPERLAEIKGISPRGASLIAEQVAEKRELRQAMMFLQKYGISYALAVKIYDAYGPELYSIVETNPYRIADDIPGVGFKIADGIADKIGIAFDSDFRIRSGIYYVLLNAVNHGHVYLPMELLLTQAQALLNVPAELMDKHVMDLVIDKRVMLKKVEDETRVYAAVYYYMEQNVARMLLMLNGHVDGMDEEVTAELDRITAAEGLDADEQQYKAVCSALTHGVTVITGGPGTGKTTTINAIIKLFEHRGKTLKLAAPTGRAAKRMTEATGHDAMTIHRLLEFVGSPEGDDASVHFEKNEANPLEADVVIIDEVSMVDIFLMNALLKAVPPWARLILVGDVNQLPSVGPGNVLADMVDSGLFEVVRLNRIFRQSEAGDIVINAHRICNGEPVDTEKKSRDFVFVRRNESGRVLGAVCTLLKEKLPAYLKVQPQQIQVLTPMRKGALGVENLNVVLQEALNPPSKDKREMSMPWGVFREGDKVMQIRNDYQREWDVKNDAGFTTEHGAGIFNGDIGTVLEINHFAEELTLEFDEGRRAVYAFKDTEEIELAYAVTVHKSQGSEYPAVVIPLISGPRPLMNRNLIYTAVTRAKECVCIVGIPETFLVMAANDEEQKRYSGLCDFLKELSEWEEY